MKKFAVLTNNQKDKDRYFTHMVRDYLEGCGCSVWIAEEIWPDNEEGPMHNLNQMPEDTECLIVLGGDGTILKATRELQGRQLPIFSVNIGTLGFLTSAEKATLPGCLSCLVTDTYQVDERMMLKGVAYNGLQLIMKNTVLNDIVISREGISRLLKLEVYVNEELLSVYEGDGIIISTPTGSSAYSLSAGGPIVFPKTDVMVITPICPHSLQSRSIVVSGSDRIRVEIASRRPRQVEEAMVTFDGDVAARLKTSDCVEICRSKETVKLLRRGKLSYSNILQRKLGSN